ncbi:MAG: tetratricopeptide repeat protein, partial [Verrucomicrobiota bacterium]|nr:tetratricopeptide repeat protein [Verrucomicrobiota bacterium]
MKPRKTLLFCLGAIALSATPLTSIHAQDSAAYTKRGIELAKAKQYDKAAEEFGQAMKVDPNDPKHYLNRGRAYRMAGKFAEAEKDFSHLIEMNKDDNDGYSERGKTRV